MKVGFGKFKGADWTEVPDSYLEWILETFDDGPAKEFVANEVRRRDDAGLPAITTEPRLNAPSAKKKRVKPTPTTCNKCSGQLVKQKRGKKTVKAGQKYYFEWYLLCKSCSNRVMVEEAKRFTQAGIDSQGAKVSRSQPRRHPDAQKHTEADWEATHYKWTGPGGREEWIPNDVDMAGRETEKASF